MFTPVVIAGGTGSRLWPLSRTLHPKQFLRLLGPDSLLQQTLMRLAALEHAAPFVLCNQAHRFVVAEQLVQLRVGGAQILLEPEGRDTAPAIALAALKAMEEGADPVLVVLAADHRIADTAAFGKSVRHALVLAEEGYLVTFGVVPTRAETGYGYVRRGSALADGYTVQAFVEKPDAETARTYLASGDYYWNSGMFVFRASRYLQELETFEPEIAAACRAAVAEATTDLDFCRVGAAAFARSPAKSVDYAVMEHAEKVAVVPLDAGWSDIGSWPAIGEVCDKDADANVLHGDVVALDSRDTLVWAESRLVATLGVENLVIVETKDAVLVAHKDRAQDIKALVAELKASGRPEPDVHRDVYRPWGQYDSVDNGQRHQVKRITVKPGARLSVQMHHHRAEHWVVVSGTAKVTNGEKTYLVAENESTFIPIGATHCLENPGVIPLELIEVQSGSYLGEDDIVRFEDKYGRK